MPTLSRSILSALAWVGLAHQARAGIAVFHDDEAYLDAAGTVSIINFLEQPDGSPSADGVLITPDFNYESLGAKFLTPSGPLMLVEHEMADFSLMASTETGSRTWIDVAPTDRWSAVAIVFEEFTTLSAYDAHGNLLIEAQPDEPPERHHDGPLFLGIVSQTPIAAVRIDRGENVEEVLDLLFTPVPEPSTAAASGLILLVVGRRLRKSGPAVVAAGAPDLPRYFLSGDSGGGSSFGGASPPPSGLKFSPRRSK